MKFKRWAAGIAALLLILSMGLISCAKPAGGTPEDNPVPQEEEEEEEIVSYKFGFSCISMENPYYETLEASIREAIEESGSSLISRDPKGDSTAQIQQIRDMIADGIQAIFLCPVDWEKIAPALTELKEADIEIINLDTQVQDREEVDAYVGSDNINAGVICGEKLIEAAPDGGQVVILECTTQNSIIDRINGFEETIAGKGFEVVERSETGGRKTRPKRRWPGSSKSRITLQPSCAATIRLL
ncbi:MAG: substrate-binding domain-containing protein [Sellimonas intestinalis]|uniref:substrate-binding domain-containing protein n=1 Tax=Sellimonas intestinalis TaxID=1653434 RepID=UPI0039A17699